MNKNGKRDFTLNELSMKYFFSNKKQNFVTLIAILLTTIMITVIFTIEWSVQKSTEQATCRQVGTTSDITFESLTQEQANIISKHSLIKKYGNCIYIGVGANSQLEGAPTEIRYSDDEFAKMSLDYPLVGKMPQKVNEIATNTIVLDFLNIPHRVGEKITLKWKKSPNSSTYETSEFILSGFSEGDIISSANMIWVSKNFVNEQLSLEDIDGNVIINVALKNHENPEKIAKKILLDTGLNQKDIKCTYNWAYEDSLDFNTKVLYALGIFLIFISGYLIINNTIQISLSKEIQFYGRLKTIGMTSKQIHRLLRKQVFYLCAIGVPIGLFIGYGIGFLILPVVLYKQSGAYSLSTSPFIFALAALIAIITVLISSEKAIRVTKVLSPIEAVRYQVQNDSSKKRNKKTRKDTRLIWHISL